MTKKIKDISPSVARDLLHNLDPTDEVHMQLYKRVRYYFIGGNEGVGFEAYDDETGKTVTDLSKVTGKVTIGIGFNMDAEGARKVWTTVFGSKVDFDKARRGEISLTDKEVEMLFNYTISTRLEEIKSHYRDIFDQLRLNERLAIEDAYFNSPKLVGPNTNFYKHLHDYYATGRREHLESATNEIRYRSNPKKIEGLRVRREKQAEILSSFKSLVYSRPGEAILPYLSKILAKLAETVIPRGAEAWPQRDPGSDSNKYFIWRTQCDEKVREEHIALEGKIFSEGSLPKEGMPGDAYGCRCYAEPLPANVEVVEQTKTRVYRKQPDIDFDRLLARLERIQSALAGA